VIGTVLYNEILVLPFWGFDQWTKDAILARKVADSEEKGQDTIGFTTNAL